MALSEEDSIKLLRSHFAFFGQSVDNLTDEELRQEIAPAWPLVESLGTLLQETTQQIRQLVENLPSPALTPVESNPGATGGHF